MADLAFGAPVLVHATVARVTRPGWGTIYTLHDRRDPKRGAVPYGPDEGWPGEAIKHGAPDGYDLEPSPGGKMLGDKMRLRRLPTETSHGGPVRGVVIGSCIRYEGTYYAPTRYYDGENEPGKLGDLRAVRLLEVALVPWSASSPAQLVLVWHEDCEVADA